MPAKIDVGLHSAQVLGKNIVYKASVNPGAWEKHRLWGFNQSGYLKAQSSTWSFTIPTACIKA